MAIRAASCRCSVALGIVALSAASSPAGAGVWTLEPAMSASTEYSTNPLLRTEQPQYGASLVANLGLPAQWDDGAGHVELAPRARLAEAGGDSAIGGSGYYLSALGEQKSERSESTASIRWSDDSSAIREPAAGTLVRSTVRERFWDGSLKWAHAWSDRTQSVLAATWQDLTYGAVRMPGLFDYRYATSAASLSTAPSERSSLRLDLAESRYEVKEFGNAQSNTSLQAGWSRRLSVPWTYQLAFGWSRLESSASSAHPAGPTYLASTQYGGELVDWAASISRSVQPSGFGTLALTLESSTSFTLRTSERSS